MISLHPEWAEAILEGRKTVEFRRAAPASEVSHVVIYATKPVGEVVGYFSVRSVHTGSPSNLWKRFGARGAISRRRFRDYFHARSTGFAIEIGDVIALKKPVPIRAVGGKTPPQNFCYVSETVLTSLAS
jgi:predicted transcriptional regulator